jgi:hypothetical protein
MVIYDDSDIMVSYQSLVARHNHLVNNIHDQSLFINKLYLTSAYINPTDPLELLIPLNLLNQSFSPRLFLGYNTGQTKEVFEGSDPVTLIGWDDAVIGEVGETFPLVLSYKVTGIERSTIVDPYVGDVISTTYRVLVVSDPEDVNVKLFCIPIYNGSVFELQYYLYDLLRDTNTLVTGNVSYENDTVFDGSTYNEKQQLDLLINLGDVDQGKYGDLQFITTIEIELVGPPTIFPTTYRLWYYRDESRWFGDDLRADMVDDLGTTTVSLQGTITSLNDFYEEHYYKAAPLWNPAVESEAMLPDYVDIIDENSNMVTMAVADHWNGSVEWTHAKPADGTQLTLEWYSYDGDSNRLDLAKTNVPVNVM